MNGGFFSRNVDLSNCRAPPSPSPKTFLFPFTVIVKLWTEETNPNDDVESEM